MKLYKLTNQGCTTQNNTKWGKGVTHEVKKTKKPRLCSKDVLHAYSNKNIAFLLNIHHGNIQNPILWEAEGDIAVRDYGKVGCFSLTTTKKLEIPSWVGSDKDRQVRVMFAVLCAESVLSVYEKAYPNDKLIRKAIEAARKCANNPTSDAAARAARAARAAARAARAAAYAAARAAADAAADAAYAAYAAYAAADAADAAYAAAYAAYAADAIDFDKLADRAVRLIMTDDIQELGDGEILVFGSNSEGSHIGGAAKTAVEKFGAIMGQGEGFQGSSYAIPSMDGLKELGKAIKRFYKFAKEHPELTFLLTAVGTGIAGHSVEDVKKLLPKKNLTNVYLPKEFK